jgi:hypothetical protein
MKRIGMTPFGKNTANEQAAQNMSYSGCRTGRQTRHGSPLMGNDVTTLAVVATGTWHEAMEQPSLHHFNLTSTIGPSDRLEIWPNTSVAYTLLGNHASQRRSIQVKVRL